MKALQHAAIVVACAPRSEGCRSMTGRSLEQQAPTGDVDPRWPATALRELEQGQRLSIDAGH
jgi:hypothetical protein